MDKRELIECIHTMKPGKKGPGNLEVYTEKELRAYIDDLLDLNVQSKKVTLSPSNN